MFRSYRFGMELYTYAWVGIVCYGHDGIIVCGMSYGLQVATGWNIYDQRMVAHHCKRGSDIRRGYPAKGDEKMKIQNNNLYKSPNTIIFSSLRTVSIHPGDLCGRRMFFYSLREETPNG